MQAHGGSLRSVAEAAKPPKRNVGKAEYASEARSAEQFEMGVCK